MTERPRYITVEVLWTPEDLSLFLGIPEKTLTDWRYRGKGPSFKRLGKHVRYRPEDVTAWLDEIDDAARPDLTAQCRAVFRQLPTER